MNMLTLRVADILKDNILVDRESARVIGTALTNARCVAPSASGADEGAGVVFDFAGIEGVSPSFVDELVRVFESFVDAKSPAHERHMIVRNPPTRLSSKFEAIARGHGISIRTMPDGSWLWTSVAGSDV